MAALATLAIWWIDMHPRQPVNFKQQYEMVRSRDEGRHRNPEKLEELSVFDEEHTLSVCKKSARNEDKVGYRHARERQLGNVYDPAMMVFFPSDLKWKLGLLSEPLRVEQLAWR